MSPGSQDSKDKAITASSDQSLAADVGTRTLKAETRGPVSFLRHTTSRVHTLLRSRFHPTGFILANECYNTFDANQTL